MSANLPNDIDDKNIDLSALSKGVGNTFDKLAAFIFNCIQFVIKNIIVIGILMVLGVALGIYMDRAKIYENQIIVNPNFQSTNYLYDKIELLNAKAKSHDTVFLKSIGIENPSKLLKITIKPINDIYTFVNNNEFRLKTLTLMAEDTAMEKLLADETTSRNYTYHVITFNTSSKTDAEKTVNPILKYINSSTYFIAIQKQFVENLKIKIQENDLIIKQINDILDQAAKDKSGGTTFFSGDSQINDIITSKEALIREQANNRISLLTTDKVIKETSYTLNVLDPKSINGSLKILLPILFIGIFVFCYLLVSFYKKQSRKQRLNN